MHRLWAVVETVVALSPFWLPIAVFILFLLRYLDRAETRQLQLALTLRIEAVEQTMHRRQAIAPPAPPVTQTIVTMAPRVNQFGELEDGPA
jgi:hypothetical protein